LTAKKRFWSFVFGPLLPLVEMDCHDDFHQSIESEADEGEEKEEKEYRLSEKGLWLSLFLFS